jgi:hypothetical protein
MKYANGNIYMGDWQYDERSGQGVLTFAQGFKYMGSFEKDQMHG